MKIGITAYAMEMIPRLKLLASNFLTHESENYR
jgi:hypothetical protein